MILIPMALVDVWTSFTVLFFLGFSLFCILGYERIGCIFTILHMRKGKEKKKRAT